MPASALQTLNLALLTLLVGSTGTIAQIVWMRIAVQWLGSSATTTTIVLATVMAGLGTGAALVGRRLEEEPCPFRKTGWMMGCTACTLLISVLIYAGLGLSITEPHRLPYRWEAHGSIVLVLFMTNLFLGAILPTLASASGSKNRFSQVGWVYCGETIGAAVGALLTGYWLIHAFGLFSTLILAVGLSLVGVILAFSISRMVREVSLPDGSRALSSSRAHLIPHSNNRISRPILAAIVLAGIGSMGLEVVWQRLLIMIVGTDTHSYTVVTTSYLLGIAIGAAASGGWLRNRFRRSHAQESNKVTGTSFAWLQIAIGASSFVLMLAFCQFASGTGQEWLASSSGWEWLSPGLQRFLISSALLAIPTILIGASFPIAVAAMAAPADSLGGSLEDSLGESPGDSSGRIGARRFTAFVYAVCCLGNIIGVLVAGYVLIPSIGLQCSVILLGWISIAAGLLAIAPALRIAPTLAALTMIGFSGFHYRQVQPIGYPALRQDYQSMFYREGLTSTVHVLMNRKDQTNMQMSVDGVVIGESRGGVAEKQLMLAHLPFLFSPPQNDSKRHVLTIGLGTGILGGEVIRLPGVDHLTCVELSPTVIEAAKLFSKFNGNLLENKKATIVHADGLHYLRETDAVFDTLISDAKSRPGHVGNVPFFSVDYYQSAVQKMTSDGIFIQWFSLEASPEQFEIVIKSFAESFGHAWLGIAAPDSAYLVGSKRQISVSEDSLSRYLESPEAAQLRERNWASADDFRSMGWLEVRDIVPRLQKSVVVNRLEIPVLERFAIESNPTLITTNKLENLRFLNSLTLDQEIESLDIHSETAAADQLGKDAARQACGDLITASIESLQSQPGWLDRSADLHLSALERLPSLNRGKQTSELYRWAADEYGQKKDFQSEKSALVKAAKLAPGDLFTLTFVGERLLARGSPTEAADYLYQATRLAEDRPEVHTVFGKCLLQLGKLPAAIRVLETAIQLNPNDSEAHLYRGLAARAQGDPQLAEHHFQTAYRLSPHLKAIIGQ